MSSVGYLLIALILSGVGTAVLVLRSRKPTSMESGIEEFARGMRALAPEEPPHRQSMVRPHHDEPSEGGASSG